MLNSTDNGACRMTDDLVNKLHELDCRISSNFPLEAKMLEYYRRLKDENVVETSQEYVNMAYDISSMYFNDALVLLPIVLHVEISRMIASYFGGCAECVVFWICDLSRQDMQNLTLAQLVVIRDWIELVAANGFVDEGIIKDAVDAIGIAINARIKNGERP